MVYAGHSKRGNPIKSITTGVKRAIKKLSTPRDFTQGGRYKFDRVGSQIIRTKAKK